MHTPWPLLALDMLRANLVGALFTFAFLRFGMPTQDALTFNDVAGTSQAVFIGYLLIATIVGGYFTIRLSLPVLIWQRRRSRLDDEFARHRALQLPALLTRLNLAMWIVGGSVFAITNLAVSQKNAFIGAVATLIGALVTCVLGYLQVEKVLRPITVAAMANDPDSASAPSITTRITVFWAVSVGVPLAVIVLLITLERLDWVNTDAVGIQRPIVWMATAALIFSTIAITRVVGAINDPIKQLRKAQNEVSAGNLNASVKIYDGSDLGLLQAGFNDMVADLRERQDLRNLFGRYVGEDVARRAIETGTELGGEERYVGVLFVDIVGSTRLAVDHPPREVVELLNEFFRVVVSVVGKHGGFVNKFQGDAALAVFGAPVDSPTAHTDALATARELAGRMRELQELDFGIGVAAGQVFAGFVGALNRFEYTVIGDAVNESARLADRAKKEPGRVLCSAAALHDADTDEREHWVPTTSEVLRGRSAPTEMFAPTA